MPDRHADEARTMAERLADAEETLRAIRSGEVDALVVETAAGDRVFTLHRRRPSLPGHGREHAGGRRHRL